MRQQQRLIMKKALYIAGIPTRRKGIIFYKYHE